MLNWDDPVAKPVTETNLHVPIPANQVSPAAVAVKTEAALIKRTADLFTYIYTVAIIGGDFNLMNNHGRLDIIKHVVRELRVMRGLAYGSRLRQ